MAIHQISIFLENRAGQLAEITALLAKNGVDLRAINIAETSDYGVLRLIASHEPEACRVLRENGFIFSTSDVVAVGVPDAPGGLSTLLQLLAENSIDVHYMYSIFGQPNGMACMILRVADPAAVSSLLAANGINMRKLESRPLRGQRWKYVFFADVESDLEDPRYAPLLETLHEVCTSFRILGSYPTGPQLDRLDLHSETSEHPAS